MPARTGSGNVARGGTYKRTPKRTRVVSRGGHPSQGSATVGGGTSGRKPTAHRSPTPKPKTTHSAPTKRGQGKRVSDFERAVKARMAEPFSPESKYNKAFMFTDPDSLVRFNYKEMLREMWPHLGLKGKRPGITINKKQSSNRTKAGGSAAAYAYRGINHIFVEPNTPWRAHFDRDQYDVIAHEAKHTRQRPGDQPTWLVEGQAMNFQDKVGRDVLRKLGIKAGKDLRLTPEYEAYLRRYRRYKRQRAKRRAGDK